MIHETGELRKSEPTAATNSAGTNSNHRTGARNREPGNALSHAGAQFGVEKDFGHGRKIEATSNRSTDASSKKEKQSCLSGRKWKPRQTRILGCSGRNHDLGKIFSRSSKTETLPSALCSERESRHEARRKLVVEESNRKHDQKNRAFLHARDNQSRREKQNGGT